MGVAWVAWVAVGLLVAGCAGPQTTVGGMPRARVRPALYDYRPMDLTPPARPVPSAPLMPAVPRVQGLVLPPHEVAWEPAAAKRAWRYIVIHHSATRKGSAAVFDNWHRNGNHWDELGYHFVIGNGTGSGNGETEVGSRWPKQKHGAHCKVGQDKTYNETGIGICLVGDFERTRPTSAQMASVARLVDYLSARYQVDDARIIGHGHVDATRCPGRYFPFDDLFSRLRSLRGGRQMR